MKQKMNDKAGTLGTQGTADDYRRVAWQAIRRSATNPRKTFNGPEMNDLTVSIQQNGIQVPLIVRALPHWELHPPELINKKWRARAMVTGSPLWKDFSEGAADDGEKAAKAYVAAENEFKFELVAGERRHRVAEKLDLVDVPVIVKEMDDRKARQIQDLENSQRAALNPLEEAAGYESMMKDFGWKVEQLADYINKSRSHVFAKLALLKAPEAVRKALEEGNISASVAELIGRVPGEKLQKQALTLIVNKSSLHWEDHTSSVELMSYRKASKLLRDEFTTDLNKARFDTKREFVAEAFADMKLTRAGLRANACDKCPMRSGNAVAEYPDIKSPDVCTDPACFQIKTDLHTQAALQKAAVGGLQILDAKEALGVFRYGYLQSDAFIKVDSEEGKLAQSKLKRDVPMPVVMADEEGCVVKLFRKSDLVAACGKSGVQLRFDNDRRDVQRETPEMAAKRELEGKVENETNNRVLRALVPCINAGKKNVDLMRQFMVRMAHGSFNWPGAQRYWSGPKVGKMTLNDMVGFCVLAVIVNYGGSVSSNVREFGQIAGIDVKKIEKEVKDELNKPKELALGLTDGKLSALDRAKNIAAARAKWAKAKGKEKEIAEKEMEELEENDGLPRRSAADRARLQAEAKKEWEAYKAKGTTKGTKNTKGKK